MNDEIQGDIARLLYSLRGIEKVIAAFGTSVEEAARVANEFSVMVGAFDNFNARRIDNVDELRKAIKTDLENIGLI